MHRFMSGLSVLFHWYIFLFFFFVPVPYCLHYCSFAVESKVRRSDCSSYIFLAWDCFGYLGVFCVSIQIVQFFVLILWKMPFIFSTDCIDSVDCFGEYGHFLTIRISILLIKKLVYLFICLCWTGLLKCRFLGLSEDLTQ